VKASTSRTTARRKNGRGQITARCTAHFDERLQFNSKRNAVGSRLLPRLLGGHRWSRAPPIRSPCSTSARSCRHIRCSESSGRASSRGSPTTPTPGRSATVRRSSSAGIPATALAVCAGTIRISNRSADGKDVVFNLVGPGGIVGEIALLDGQERTADAQAGDRLRRHGDRPARLHLLALERARAGAAADRAAVRAAAARQRTDRGHDVPRPPGQARQRRCCGSSPIRGFTSAARSRSPSARSAKSSA